MNKPGLLLTACLVLSALAPTAQTAGLGRLFFTPQERAQLNTLRQTWQAQRYQPPPDPVEESAENTPPPLPQSITLNGLVLREHGPPVLWFNGSPLTHPGLRVDPHAARGIAVPLFIVNEEKQVTLKPGQSLNTGDGTVTEGYLNSPKDSP